jgi:hypothetical protein
VGGGEHMNRANAWDMMRDRPRRSIISQESSNTVSLPDRPAKILTVFHKRNQRRDHDRHLVQMEGRKLVAQALPGPDEERARIRVRSGKRLDKERRGGSGQIIHFSARATKKLHI